MKIIAYGFGIFSLCFLSYLLTAPFESYLLTGAVGFGACSLFHHFDKRELEGEK